MTRWEVGGSAVCMLCVCVCTCGQFALISFITGHERYRALNEDRVSVSALSRAVAKKVNLDPSSPRSVRQLIIELVPGYQGWQDSRAVRAQGGEKEKSRQLSEVARARMKEGQGNGEQMLNLVKGTTEELPKKCQSSLAPITKEAGTILDSSLRKGKHMPY